MRRRRRFPAALVAATALVAAGAGVPSDAAEGRTTRASQGRSQPNGPSPATSVPDTTSPAMSLDGAWIVFSSDASNLVPGDTNGVADVFARSVVTGRVVRVSVSGSERQGNGPSYSPAVSGYGTIVAFVSEASNLVSGDRNGMPDVFVRDLTTGRTERVSVSSSEREADGASRQPFVSLFGRYVAFESAAFNLASGDANGMPDVFVRDRERGRTERIPPPPAPSYEPIAPEARPPADVPRPFETAWTMHPSLSFDGRTVAFVRAATTNVPTTPWLVHPSSQEIYLYDRPTRRYVHVRTRREQGLFKVLSARPVIAADGRSVVFESWSVLDDQDALVRNPGDPVDIYRYDVPSRNLARVSINSWGLPGNGDSRTPWTTTHGEAVVFASDATNLVAGDTNGATDVFVYDGRSRTTSRMSVGGLMDQANGASVRPVTDFSAARVAYASTATNLVRGDGNGFGDVFVRERYIRAVNRKPDLLRLGASRTIDMFTEFTVRLRARDGDRDPVRFGILAGKPAVPRDASIDPVTGVFRWTPDWDEAGPWEIFFWVDDPAGASDIEIGKFFVRDAPQVVCGRAGVSC